jgi:aromatic ring-opening dioxygenase catalytic subunit (LigB family)
MPIVFACAASHAPGIRAWTERAPQNQVDVLFGGYDAVRKELEAAAPDTIVLLTSEHWANFFLDHIGAFCVGRGETFEGPIEPWLRVEKSHVKGNPALAGRILEHCYAHGFELSYAHEMKFDHGSMVPLSFLLPKMDRRVVPIMFNTLATPRPTAARCLALGKTLRPVLDAAEERIAVVATGGLSHDPGEINHGVIDTEFDARFLDNMASGKPDRLAGYTDSEFLKAGAGTLELLAWICLAGVMGECRARVIAYEAVKPWATGMGIIAYDRAA